MVLFETLKFLGALIACISTVLCAYDRTTSTRDASGLTRRGKRLVALSIGGFAIAALIQGLQVKNTIDSLEATRQRNIKTADKLERILKSSEHAAYKVNIKKLSLDIGLYFSSTDVEFAAYCDRLNGILEKGMQHLGDKYIFKTDEYMVYQKAGQAPYLTVYSDTSLWPNPSDPKEALAAEILNVFTIILFFETGNHPVDNPQIDVNALMMTASGRLDGQNDNRRLPIVDATIIYSPQNKQLSIHIDDAPIFSLEDFNENFIGRMDFIGANIKGELALPSNVKVTLGELFINFEEGGNLIAVRGSSIALVGDKHLIFARLARHYFNDPEVAPIEYNQ